MANQNRVGWRSVLIATISLLTVAAPGVLSLLEINRTSETATQADEKVDLGYDLLRQRVEFLVERLDQSCADVRELRIVMMTRFAEEPAPSLPQSAVTAPPPVARRYARGGDGAVLRPSISDDIHSDLDFILPAPEVTLPQSDPGTYDEIKGNTLPMNLGKALMESKSK